jgi:cytochrome b6-f complex iron-sulfur subunit
LGIGHSLLVVGYSIFFFIPMSKKNNPKEEATKGGQTRRSFLNKLWVALGIIALMEIIGLVAFYLRPRRKKVREKESGGLITAGKIAAFDPHSVTAFQRGQFYLVRLKEGGFLAISRQCTHLGCTVPWIDKEGKFKCPCHASEFDITGNVVHSPAPRALDLFEVIIENQVVLVNTGKRIKRSQFEPSQVVYPDN